jgi:hypothetical protein
VYSGGPLPLENEMNTDEREDDEGGRDSGTETGGQITRNPRAALCVHAARSARRV